MRLVRREMPVKDMRRVVREVGESRHTFGEFINWKSFHNTFSQRRGIMYHVYALFRVVDFP